MQTFDTVESLRKYVSQYRKLGETIGFVPTMGALHAGHLALVRRCKQENDLAVCSIYVNPAQFNSGEDLANYPRTLEADRQLLQGAGCDVLFAPTDAQMYPQPAHLKMDFGSLETVLEGRFRPGHFNGVGIVVAKLFHIVQPGAAYFGQKDLQQCLVVRQLIRDLSFPIEMKIHPTVREADGLAMSSRNRRLASAQRAAAPLLYQALLGAREILANGGTVESARETVRIQLLQSSEIRLEYFEVADSQSLAEITSATVPPPYALCIAAHLGSVRLIDNLLVE